jgi:50S ribosomal subunit-associated GTPase HflX
MFCFRYAKLDYKNTLKFITHGPKPRCMVINPLISAFQAKKKAAVPPAEWMSYEAIKLVQSRKWDVMEGMSEPRPLSVEEFLERQLFKSFGLSENDSRVKSLEQKHLPRLEDHQSATLAEPKSTPYYNSEDTSSLTTLSPSPPPSSWLTVRSNEEESDEECDLDDLILNDPYHLYQFTQTCTVKINHIAVDTFLPKGKLEELLVFIGKSKNPPNFVFINAHLTTTQCDQLEQCVNQALAANRGLLKSDLHEEAKMKQMVGYIGDDEQSNYEKRQAIPKYIEIIDRSRMLIEVLSERAKSEGSTGVTSLQLEISKLQWLKRDLSTSNKIQKLSSSLSMLQKYIAPFQESLIGHKTLVTDVSQTHLGKSNKELTEAMIIRVLTRLRKKIEKIRSEKQKQRNQREQIVSFALVGYVNSGKTAILNECSNFSGSSHNLLTSRSRDIWFQTIESKTRRIKLPSRNFALMTDTIGIIGDVSQFMYEPFQAALEDIRSANFLLNIRDSSCSQEIIEYQNSVVRESLLQAGFTEENLNERMVDVWSKCDLEGGDKGATSNGLKISAESRLGFDDLLEFLDSKCADLQQTRRLKFKFSRLEAVKFVPLVRANCLAFYDDLYEVSEDGEEITVEALVDQNQLNKLKAHPDLPFPEENASP